MEELHQWLREQAGQRKLEPNSSLGEAISYLLNHWEPMTLFLCLPGTLRKLPRIVGCTRISITAFATPPGPSTPVTTFHLPVGTSIVGVLDLRSPDPATSEDNACKGSKRTEEPKQATRLRVARWARLRGLLDAGDAVYTGLQHRMSLIN